MNIINKYKGIYFNNLSNFIKEKFSGVEIVVISILLTLSIIGLIFYSRNIISNKFFTDRIIYTGKITEGIVGNLDNLNPSQPNSQIEKDITLLIFSGLIKNNTNSKNDYKLNLAEKIEISSDGLTYKIFINPKAKFHDEKEISARDILSSFENIKNSPAFEGVEIGQIDNKTINFTLTSPFPNFINKLNFPIIPENLNPTFSENTIGSGIFKIKSISKDNDNNINQINLIRFEDKLPRPAYLKEYNLKIYKDSDSLSKGFKNKEIDITSSLKNKDLGELVSKNAYNLATTSMNTHFVLFVNQTKNPALKFDSLRHFISQSINREKIKSNVFGGYADISETISPINVDKIITVGEKELAKSDLIYKDGLLISQISSENATKTDKVSKQLELNLLIIDTIEMQETANNIVEDLKLKGIKVNKKVINTTEIPNAIKEKNFDLFLFGFNVSDVSDYFSFFHSSQITYPKLNIASFANKRVDVILDKLKTFKNLSDTDKTDLLSELSDNIYKEMPVIFLYKPHFVIAKNNNLNISLNSSIISSEERYLSVEKWWIESEKVLKIFQENNLIKKIELLF